MTVFIFVLALVYANAEAAPPLYTQTPAHLPINPLSYLLEGPEVNSYYNQAETKQDDRVGSGSPAHLETLEPDSEVELIPGAQPPQQPPQQPPISPNLPGLAPGQRVFIVHMPVPGYRPGTIGGYQPVYVVAAAPQGNTAYTPNGYQSGFFVDPSGQTILSPAPGYAQPGAGLAQGMNPGLVLRTPSLPGNSPYDLVYQNPAVSYQPALGLPGVGGPGALRFAQLVALQGQHQPRTASATPPANGAHLTSESKRFGEESERLKTKLTSEEALRTGATAHAQTRKP